MPADPSSDAPVTSVRALDPTDAAERRAGSAAAARAAAAALEGVEPRPGVPKPDPILVADGVARASAASPPSRSTTSRCSAASSPR
jgi:hypothetical protein